MKVEVKSYTDKETGLTSNQALSHKKNTLEASVSKTYTKILKEHVFTFFNMINVVLAVLVIFTGSYRNMLFMLVVIFNMIIGLIQEIRSKRKLDKLALVHQQKIHVLRDGHISRISIDQIVEDDILIIKSGDQVPCDGVLREGSIECDESMLTGESDAIEKFENDSIFSGSIIVSGQAKMQVVTVGEDTYAHSILKHAKREKRYPSQLRDSIQSIIRFSTIVLLPAGVLLFLKQFLSDPTDLNDAILSTVAAVVGMIPEGLVLLTSIALSVGVMKLTQKNVLVQELYCIETLARVDTLCLDKTGTITQGEMKVIHIDTAYDLFMIKQTLANMFSSLQDDNTTAKAIREYVSNIEPTQITKDIIPFSSSRKACGAVFQDAKYILGAYSFIIQKQDPEIIKKLNEYGNKGYRTLILARSNSKDHQLYGDFEILAFILIQDALRKDASTILSYFKKQNVDLKIISGDDEKTVSALAKEAGVTGKSIDMTGIQDVRQVIEDHAIFGRVTPEQKKEMIIALKEKGHTVAMTGDGVNDVMALKEADCSIAMGSGSEAAKKIASMVLLNDQFKSLPSILHEGRCIINNIQRTASLFLVKTLFSFGLSLLTLVWLTEYPFQPIQLTLISTLATGLPSFILTLEPNATRVEGNFLVNVFSRALPGAICVVVSVILASILTPVLSTNSEQFSTICTLIAGFNALCVLTGACIPFTRLRHLLVICMIAFFAISIIFFHNFFYIVPLNITQIIFVLIVCVMIPFIQRFLNLWFKKQLRLHYKKG